MVVGLRGWGVGCGGQGPDVVGYGRGPSYLCWPTRVVASLRTTQGGVGSRVQGLVFRVSCLWFRVSG